MKVIIPRKDHVQKGSHPTNYTLGRHSTIKQQDHFVDHPGTRQTFKIAQVDSSGFHLQFNDTA